MQNATIFEPVILTDFYTGTFIFVYFIWTSHENNYILLITSFLIIREREISITFDNSCGAYSRSVENIFQGRILANCFSSSVREKMLRYSNEVVLVLVIFKHDFWNYVRKIGIHDLKWESFSHKKYNKLIQYNKKGNK